MNTFEQHLEITKKHLDDLQHVNNVQYLQWVQDIAGAHWQQLIKGKAQTFGLWVVRSHHIEYKRQVKLGDRLRVVTHVEVTEGFQSERHVRFFLNNTTTLVVHCRTQWCYLDAQSHRLMRIPIEIHKLFEKEPSK